jgi:lipopolysaccharide/colanic/teichoic acid biosynthesis glycosyltransferase
MGHHGMHGTMDHAEVPVSPLAGLARSATDPVTDGWGASTARWQTRAKRALDVAVAVVALILVLPVGLAAAIGVKLSSPGPVFFSQVRVGRHGATFRMLKFRSFPVDHVDVEQSLPTDACPLRFGRFLRRTSIDELPQLLNVLRGEMSLVGPRPERPRFAEDLARAYPAYADRHRAPAGITGLAQIRGLCGPTSIADRICADNEYIDGWSLASDLDILLRTVPAVVRKFRW